MNIKTTGMEAYMYASQVVWFDSHLFPYPDIAILQLAQSVSVIMAIKSTLNMLLIFGCFLNIGTVMSQLAPAYE